MKTIKGLLAAVAGAALVTATTASAAAPGANPAARLSVSRVGAPTAHASRIGADVPTTTLISIGILAALVAIVLVATDDDDDADSN